MTWAGLWYTLMAMTVSFPRHNESWRISRLVPPSGPVRMVLDTDTYNELDDQFALVYALLSGDRLTVEAVYAAPFWNQRADTPAQGMERSYAEIVRLLQMLERSSEDFVFEGARNFMPGPDQAVENPAARDLVERAMSRRPEDDPLYVAAIGAPTNVASAMVMAPEIIERVVVVWLGGHPYHWHTTGEFNMKQDLHASRVLLGSGVPLVQVPCRQVAEQLRTTVHELRAMVKGKGTVGDYLYRIYRE